MNAADMLLKGAAAWFTEAIRAHVAEHPDQARGWLEMFEAGRARATVVIEIVPEQVIRCGFELEDKIVAFHTTALREIKGQAN